MKKAIIYCVFLLTLTTLFASSLENGVTYKATDKTWDNFVKYTNTKEGVADSLAMEFLGRGKDSVLRTTLRTLTFYPDGKLLVANDNYTEVYIISYYVSQKRVLITRKDSNEVFGTHYSYESDDECIHFGYLSNDESSIGLNPFIQDGGAYFTLYKI